MRSGEDATEKGGRKTRASNGRVILPVAGEVEVEHTLGWLLHDIHRLLTRQFESRIRHLGLTRPQWRVLLNLFRADGATQTELADLTEMEKAPLGKILDKLEEGGWIKRKDDPRDRRARRVYCTAKIERYAPDVEAAGHAMFAVALAGMRPKDIEALIAELQRMKKNLGGTDD